MPELPDITVYIEALHRRLIGRSLRQIQISSPFLLRTVMPPLQELLGHRVMELRRLGKRIAIGFEEQLWLVLHLMIAGRLHWLEPGVMSKNRCATKPGGSNPKPTRSVKRIPHQQALLALDNGTLLLTEAGTKKRASIHLVRGQLALQGLNPGGLEVLDCTTGEFAAMLTSQNHTLKRALTDPRLFSGIGNAYSD